MKYPTGYNYVYCARDGLVERRGQWCRILVQGCGPGPRNRLIQFKDGFITCTTFFKVRPLKQRQP